MTVGAVAKSASQSLNFKSNAPPAGVVVAFNGTLSEIPEGWALADGQNGTVDLQGYFVEGTDTDDQVKTTEGEDTKQITTVPGHTHPDATWQDPDSTDHQHDFGGISVKNSGDSSLGSNNNIKAAYPNGTGDTFSVSASHDHNTADTTSSSGSGNAVVENKPSYVELHFIQKIES